MFRKRDPERDRYYLLPGMGKLNRQKHLRFRLIALLVGSLVSLLIALILIALNR